MLPVPGESACTFGLARQSRREGEANELATTTERWSMLRECAGDWPSLLPVALLQHHVGPFLPSPTEAPADSSLRVASSSTLSSTHLQRNTFAPSPSPPPPSPLPPLSFPSSARAPFPPPPPLPLPPPPPPSTLRPSSSPVKSGTPRFTSPPHTASPSPSSPSPSSTSSSALRRPSSSYLHCRGRREMMGRGGGSIRVSGL